jgi:hypothetical protein
MAHLALAERPDTTKAKEEPYDTASKRRMLRAYESNKEKERIEQREHRRYYHATTMQWSEEEQKVLKARGQAPVFDNRIARKIDFLVGVEQRMRRDPKAFPRTPKEEGGADVATAGLRYACDRNRWENLASDAMYSGLIAGIGVLFVGIEQGRDGNEPVLKAVDQERFFYDPRSIRTDFSDARYLGLDFWLDIDEAKERYKKFHGELDATLEMSKGGGSAGQGTASDIDLETNWGDFEHRRVRVVEFWEKGLVAKPMQQDAMMGSTAMTQPEMVVGWSYCFFCGDTTFEHGVSPYLDENGAPDCPYVAWSPYVDETGGRYGPIRNMKPMQDEVNHRRSKFLHWLNHKQIFTRKGDLDDHDHTRRELGRPDGVIEHNGEWGTTTGVVDVQQEIQGQAELLAQAQSSLENLGPNPGLVGKGGGVADQSGRAILAQRDSGMTELSPVFERCRDWKLRVYRKTWNRIKQSWTAEKWIRITDDEGSPAFLGLNNMSDMSKPLNPISEIDVDIILDEGPDTITMNEELMQQFSQLGEAAMGPLGKIIIELSNTPQKARLIKMIDDAQAPSPELAEVQKRMAQLEELLKASMVDKAIAETENKRADTVAKLATAFTPKAPQLDEFGRPKSAPSAPPDFNMAMQAMQMFPLYYAQPTLEQGASAPAPMPMDDEGMEGERQGGPQGPQFPGAGMIPQQPQLPPEILAQAGSLPLDPAYAG